MSMERFYDCHNERGFEWNYPVNVEDLLKLTIQKDGSDLHLAAGAPPLVRIYGELVAQEFPKLGPVDIAKLVEPILLPEHIKKLNTDWELDFSYSIAGIARFRGNIMIQRGSLAVVFRAVPYNPPDLDTLGLPRGVKDLCFKSRGLVLVTGPTGSGKSTTLASMIDLINSNRNLNIVTIEDPIEFLHTHKKSTVRQREVGTDTKAFSEALKHVLRHDPDVILIGEMRDLDSISIALTAAETGHLVLSTLHTQTAPLTINRIVDVFSDARREQIRQQLANSLQGVISQQLVPKSDGRGRVPAVEFMLNTPAIRSLIREGKEHQIYSSIQTGHSVGMQTMDQSLAKLVASGKISRDNAIQYCIDKVEVERIIKNHSFSMY